MAYSEAVSLMNIAEKISITKKELYPENIGSIITYNILVGLAIELFFKAFMIIDRDGIITKGHNLIELYKEIPKKYKDQFEKYYIDYIKEYKDFIGVIAITISKEMPNTPQKTLSDKRYSTFEESLESYSNEFVKSRYLFEDVVDTDWIQIDYAYNYGNSILKALNKTYHDLVSKQS